MIRIKREQDELKKKERELKDQENRNKEILGAQEQVKRYLAENEKYANATKDYYEKFQKAYPGEFQLIELPDEHKEYALSDYEYDDQGNRKKDAAGFSIKNTYYTQPYSLKRYEIKYKKNKKYTIVVKEHVVYGSYSLRKTSSDWVMNVKGLKEWKDEQKNLKNIKTVKDKIDDDIEESETKLSAEQREKEGLQFTKDFVTEKYKDEKPEVKIDTTWNRSWDGKSGREDKYVLATFKNGLSVKYKWNFKDGAYSSWIYNVNPHGLNSEETVNALLKVAKKA